MQQASFEYAGQARLNILTHIVAPTLVGVFALSGCASGEQDNNQGPGIEQVNSETIDTSGLTEKQQELFEKLNTNHDGTLAGLDSSVSANQNLLGADGEAFNALTITVNGREVNCGVARNYDLLADELPTDFEEATFDPTSYDRSCGGYGSSSELGLFVPYMAKIQEVAPEITPKGTPEEVVVGAIYQTGEELLSVYRNPQNSYTHDSLIDDVYESVSNWQGHGYTPTRAEVATIFNIAMTDIYDVTTEVLPENDVTPESPAPAETTEPAAEPQPTPDASEELGVVVDPSAAYPLTYVQDMFIQAPLSGAESMTYYSAVEDSFLNCREYLKLENCSETQTSALYAAANASDALYGLGVASPADLQMLTIYNIVFQANDPTLQAKGGLKTYTHDLLVADVQSQLHREVSVEEIQDVANNTAELLGVSLAEN